MKERELELKKAIDKLIDEIDCDTPKSEMTMSEYLKNNKKIAQLGYLENDYYIIKNNKR